MTQFSSAFDELNQALSAEGDVLLNLPLALVYEDPANPRDTFDEADMAALTVTVRAKGVLQPIVVRPADADGRYRIRFGARRFRAAIGAELAAIPSLVRAGPVSAVDDLIEQVIENDQRAPLSTAQLARAVAHLLDEGLTQAEVGARLGRPKDRIAMLAAVRTMPAPVQALAPKLGVRTLYELANAWKADATRVETWLRGREPADITQAQARALAASGREGLRSLPKPASTRSADVSAAASRPKPTGAAGVIVEVMVEGRAGRLVLAPGPTTDQALVRFEAMPDDEPVPLSQIRLARLRAP
jgi:ParB family chromosome partitioning protein